MVKISSRSHNRLVVRPGPPGAKPAHGRAAAHRAREHRRAVIITCCVLLVAVAAAGTVIGTGSSFSGHSSSLPQTAAATPARDNVSAKITIATDGGACSQQTFDNKTGRMTRSQKPCETTQYDNDGFPIDPDAIRRFNELKKSFAGH